MVCADVPDRHHFSGRGAKDVTPLWRDAAATEPNVTAGLVETLAEAFGVTVGPEDLFAYAYAVLATPTYVERFSVELTIPGPRLPITRDAALFREAVALGRRLVWLHTYAQRWTPRGEVPGRVPQGRARAVTPIPATAAGYPEAFAYDEATATLHVGASSFGPVDPAVWRFSVSGLEVVRSWLAYRMKKGAGRRSSPLDEIRPERWTPQLTQELLELTWVLEATIDLYAAPVRPLVSHRRRARARRDGPARTRGGGASCSRRRGRRAPDARVARVICRKGRSKPAAADERSVGPIDATPWADPGRAGPEVVSLMSRGAALSRNSARRGCPEHRRIDRRSPKTLTNATLARR